MKSKATENPQPTRKLAAAVGPVFISYSRKDYYFAESLTLALLERQITPWLDVKDLRPGVDWAERLESAIDTASCVVLIASRDSLTSPNVAAEWRRALARGIPVVAACRSKSKLPTELADIPQIDFRGRFKPALDSLAGMLEGRADEAVRTMGLHPAPPIVVATASLLLILASLPMALADWQSITSGATVGRSLTLFELAVLFASVAFFIWHTSVAYLRRRMGMTRLAVVLGYFTFAYGYPVLQYFDTPTVPAIIPEATMKVMGTTWPAAAALSLTSVLWVGLLAFWRPADLYRWSPTGKTWNSYRAKLAALGDHAALNSLSAAGPFEILCHPVDSPLAQRLEQVLTARAERTVDAPAHRKPTVLLLSNRTSLDWVAALEPQMRAQDLVTVVGSPIGLAPQLSWLWKRQWIDFRRWASTDTGREPASLPVPEALERPRLPLSVNLAHHLLCAMAGLGFVAANLVADAKQSDMETLDLLTALATGLLLWVALRFAGRRAARTHVKVWLLAAGSTLTVLTFGQFVRYFQAADFSPWIAVAGFLIATAWFAAWRWRRDVAFWLPLESQRRRERKHLLTPPRSWRTPLLFFLYAGGWMWLLGVIK